MLQCCNNLIKMGSTLSDTQFNLIIMSSQLRSVNSGLRSNQRWAKTKDEKLRTCVLHNWLGLRVIGNEDWRWGYLLIRSMIKDKRLWLFMDNKEPRLKTRRLYSSLENLWWWGLSFDQCDQRWGWVTKEYPSIYGSRMGWGVRTLARTQVY